MIFLPVALVFGLHSLFYALKISSPILHLNLKYTAIQIIIGTANFLSRLPGLSAKSHPHLESDITILKKTDFLNFFFSLFSVFKERVKNKKGEKILE